MPNELSQGGQAAPRTPMARPIEYLIVFVGILLCVAIYLVLGVVKDIQTEQQSSEIRGYKNRAVICDLQRGLGLTETKGCADPAIQPYRDKNITASSTAGARTSRETYELLCFALKQASKNPTSTLVLPPGQCGT